MSNKVICSDRATHGARATTVRTVAISVQIRRPDMRSLLAVGETVKQAKPNADACNPVGRLPVASEHRAEDFCRHFSGQRHTAGWRGRRLRVHRALWQATPAPD